MPPVLLSETNLFYFSISYEMQAWIKKNFITTIKQINQTITKQLSIWALVPKKKFFIHPSFVICSGEAGIHWEGSMRIHIRWRRQKGSRCAIKPWRVQSPDGGFDENSFLLLPECTIKRGFEKGKRKVANGVAKVTVQHGCEPVWSHSALAWCNWNCCKYTSGKGQCKKCWFKQWWEVFKSWRVYNKADQHSCCL